MISRNFLIDCAIIHFFITFAPIFFSFLLPSLTQFFKFVHIAFKWKNLFLLYFLTFKMQKQTVILNQNPLLVPPSPVTVFDKT